MLYKTTGNFIYIGMSIDDNGSPLKKEITKEDVKISIGDTFSDNYYFERGREQRTSCNAICNTYHTNNVVEDGLTYQLRYVDINGMRYTVENIMKYKHLQMKRLLDLKQTL